VLPDNRLRSADPAHWPVQADWQALLQPFWASATGRQLCEALAQRLRDGATVYPAQPLRALQLTALADVRVVVLGQDPYHGPGQAEGLAFSVPDGVRPPPSLRNVMQEAARDLGGVPPASGSLLHWARQGVLLLNTTLTVEAERPASHARLGWTALTDAVIRLCSDAGRPKAFLLWGAHAQARAACIDAQRHLVLQSNHPSPLSARRPPQPFIGCGHFGRVQAWLQDLGEKPIDWF
jgi:uracil-DNA glycosylase